MTPSWWMAGWVKGWDMGHHGTWLLRLLRLMWLMWLMWWWFSYDFPWLSSTRKIRLVPRQHFPPILCEAVLIHHVLQISWDHTAELWGTVTLSTSPQITVGRVILEDWCPQSEVILKHWSNLAGWSIFIMVSHSALVRQLCSVHYHTMNRLRSYQPWARQAAGVSYSFERCLNALEVDLVIQWNPVNLMGHFFVKLDPINAIPSEHQKKSEDIEDSSWNHFLRWDSWMAFLIFHWQHSDHGTDAKAIAVVFDLLALQNECEGDARTGRWIKTSSGSGVSVYDTLCHCGDADNFGNAWGLSLTI